MTLNYHGLIQEWKRQLELGLSEDRVRQDWTTESTLGKNGNILAKAEIIAKSPGVWTGEIASIALKSISTQSDSVFEAMLKDGASFEAGTTVARWKSSAIEILAFERTYLNLISYLCGIAKQTKALCNRVAQQSGHSIKILSTRKNLPGLRDLSLYGIQCGGGSLHRRDLASGILIKENHIEYSGGIYKAVQKSRSNAPHGMKIEIEVKNIKELMQALEADADAVLLDNFYPKLVREAVEFTKLRPDVFVEVSGGITLDTISDFIIEGVMGISVGSLTHSVRSVDFSLLMVPRDDQSNS